MKNYSVLYGVILCVILAIVAVYLAEYTIIGAVTIAITLGIFVRNFIGINDTFSSGIQFCERTILSVAIALMGIKLDFMIVEKLGVKSVVLVITALIMTLLSSVILAKIFGFSRRFSLLLGIGNGVCGSSAIAATKDIIGSNEEEVGLSVAIVNFLGTIGIFLLPCIAKFVWQASDLQFGILAGNTLQAVGQVVAAGFSVSELSGQTATIIKMTRILMLFPLVLILILGCQFRKGNQTAIQKPKIPVFIVGFILCSMIPTFNLISDVYIGKIGNISHYLLVIAMTAIGMRITVKSIVKDGKTALTIGTLIFIMQIVFSITAIAIIF